MRIHKKWSPSDRILSLWRHGTVNLCISVLLQQQLSFQNTFPPKFQVLFYYHINGDMQWRSWLRHWATCRKVAGSIPESVFEIFHSHNPSGRTMPLGLTQSLTEIPGIFPGGKGGRRVGLTLRLFSTTHCSLLRLIVRSGLDVPTFATRRLHACHHARAPSDGTWNCGRKMSGNFA